MARQIKDTGNMKMPKSTLNPFVELDVHSDGVTLDGYFTKEQIKWLADNWDSLKETGYLTYEQANR